MGTFGSPSLSLRRSRLAVAPRSDAVPAATNRRRTFSTVAVHRVAHRSEPFNPGDDDALTR